jgi:CxxC motif-containing protein
MNIQIYKPPLNFTFIRKRIKIVEENIKQAYSAETEEQALEKMLIYNAVGAIKTLTYLTPDKFDNVITDQITNDKGEIIATNKLDESKEKIHVE